MTDVDDLLEGVVYGWESTVSEHHGDLVEGRDLSRCLHDVEGVGVGRVSNTETVNGDSVVASSKSDVGVRVIVVVVRQVPVRLVEADTVRQDLNGRVRGRRIVRHAVLCADVVRTTDVLEVDERLLGEVGALLGDIENEVHNIVCRV